MSAPTFKPRTGSDEEWNEAFARVEDYFRAHRVHSRIHQAELVYKILDRAATRHEQNPDTPPVTLASGEAQDAVNGWLRHQVGEANIDLEKAGRLGRVAFLLADGPSKHPEMFLDNDLPEDVRSGMRLRLEQSCPNMEVSSMVGRDIDLGLFPDVADFAWDLINKWRYLPTLILLGLFALIVFGLLAAMKL